MKFTYKSTLAASYIGYVCQSMVVNLSPLLFYTFQKVYGITISQIATLMTINFVVQLLVDALSIKFVNIIGLKRGAVIAHIFCAIGIAGLSVFVRIFSDKFLALVIATIIAAIGGGLTEVLISPIVEALPTQQKSASMSILHSFYCWGQVIVVLLTTAFFAAFGNENWAYIPVLWAIVPFVNIFLFSLVPVRQLPGDGKFQIKKMFSAKLFIAFVILMLCTGAAEMSISQWVSYFAEAGLKVSNAVGNLLGACLFAVLMGTARVVYALNGKKIDLVKSLMLSSMLCVMCYIVAAVCQNPIISLIGCAVCGFSVGIMWPGVLSLSASCFPMAGAPMFAVLALAGDIGCSLGPWGDRRVSDLVTKTGSISSFFKVHAIASVEFGIKLGLLVISVFPIMMVAIIFGVRKYLKNKKQKN